VAQARMRGDSRLLLTRKYHNIRPENIFASMMDATV